MKLYANRQIHGTYGTKAPDEEFEVADAIGQSLLGRKLARETKEKPKPSETKQTKPSETK